MRIARLLAVTVLLALTLVAPATPQSAQPVQMRGLTVSPFLTSWYRSYNSTYFDSKLPDAIVYTGETGDMGDTRETYPDGPAYIIVSPKWNPAPNEQLITLAHETCHVYVFKVDPEAEEHGPKWHACMRRLAAAGAFDDLW